STSAVSSGAIVAEDIESVFFIFISSDFITIYNTVIILRSNGTGRYNNLDITYTYSNGHYVFPMGEGGGGVTPS
ncbi:MAG: hypothetical protein IJU30_05480, partial [Lachnospiraceae bacterium]|nr:hypothetical protein [Lachnospiraceae bacterium]